MNARTNGMLLVPSDTIGNLNGRAILWRALEWLNANPLGKDMRPNILGTLNFWKRFRRLWKLSSRIGIPIWLVMLKEARLNLRKQSLIVSWQFMCQRQVL